MDIGWPSLETDTAATNGTLFAEYFPRLPPRLSPPQ